MCLWPVSKVYLEDPPPKKKKKKKKKKGKEEKKEPKTNYILASEQLHLQPFASPSMQYPGSSPISPSVQFYSAQVQSPVGANYYQGPTTSQVNANNQARAQYVGAYNSDIQMVPQPASPNSEFWCRELSGHYTLRTMNTIMQSLQPGVWARASSGYPYFVRHAKF